MFLFHFLIAQTSFNSTNFFDGYYSGVAIGVADVNGDGLDDVVHLQQGTDLYIEFQQSNGTFITQAVGNMANSSEWSMCIGDVDNNGFSDIFTGGAYNGIKLATANSDGSNYSIEELPGPGMFIQGSNFADINNDGWIDVFACHDDAESRIWGNDGAGGFVAQDNWIDMATTPTSDNSGNYGSVWCDFDNDGDTDLYIAKCRQGVNNPDDPRRINALYVNDGNGNFTEAADAHGLKIGHQSWTADFADYDNDGDFDCFITNHDAESQLLRNDNGFFTDVTATSGINVAITPIQGIMEDFDNDGFVDLLIAGGDEQFFHNNGDGTFTELTGLFDNNDMESFALGDLNNDGFVDIYGGYAEIYTNPSNVDDVLWLNGGNNNNHLAVKLVGVTSNKSAIGARVEIHGDWGIQIREVRAGEGYGIVNSLTQYFGIGQSSSIDQIIVKWPSGIIDIIDNPTINQTITIYENNCVAPVVEITTSEGPNPILCSGESLDLIAPSGYSYLWSNNATSQNITITEGGTYQLTVTDNNNCAGISTINIAADPVEIPTVNIEGDVSFCQGGSVILTSSEASAYTWSNGETTQSITVTESNTYNVTTQGTCTTFTSESTVVDVLAAPAPTANGTTITSPQSVELMATGNNITWYDAITGGNVLATGATYTTPVLSATTTYYIEDAHQYGGEEFNVGMPNDNGADFSGSQYNGELIFDALGDFTLQSVTVYTDTPGERTVELRDAGGTVLQSATFNISGPEDVLQLDFDITAGTGYILSTNGASNNANFGDNSPVLKRHNMGVNYPYVIDNTVSLNDSNFGTEYYYYFYNWQIKLPSEDCISDRTPVTVEYDNSISITQIDEVNHIKMYPNPSNGLVNLEIELINTSDVLISITDISGKNVKDISLEVINGHSIQNLDVRTLAKGIYTAKIIINDEVYSHKLIIQ